MVKPKITRVGNGFTYFLGERVEVTFPRALHEKMPASTQANIDALMERLSWNLSRASARHLLVFLKGQIQRTGGERQRSEGVTLIKRICYRLNEWVD